MNGVRARALPLSADGVGAVAAAVALGLAGAAVFTASAYVLSPLALPIALAVAGFVLLAALRPAWALALALLAIPLELVNVELLTGRVSPTEGALAVIAAVFIIRFLALPATVVKPGWRDVPAVVLLAAIAVGLTVATDVAATARIAASFAIFFLVYLQMQSFTARELRLVFAGFGVGAGILGLIGGLSYLGPQDAATIGGAYNPQVRAIGTFEHANPFASILTLALLPAIALTLSDLRRYLWLLPFIVGAVTGLAFSLSRGGMTAFAFGLLVLVAWSRARWAALGVAAVLAGLILAGANPVPGSDQLEVVEERLSTLETGLETNIRPQIWSAAVDIASERPLTGVGMGQFQYESARRGLFGDGGGPYLNAHNVFLSFAAETGLVGLAAFVVFLAQVLARGVRAVTAARERIDRGLGIGIVAALLAFLVQGLAEAQVTTPVVAAGFFVLAGAATTLADRTRPAALRSAG